MTHCWIHTTFWGTYKHLKTLEITLAWMFKNSLKTLLHRWLMHRDNNIWRVLYIPQKMVRIHTETCREFCETSRTVISCCVRVGPDNIYVKANLCSRSKPGSSTIKGTCTNYCPAPLRPITSLGKSISTKTSRRTRWLSYHYNATHG
jgi:hypothetical protein